MRFNDYSRFISLILRHKPETIGITLDKHGWANVDELIVGINQQHPFTLEMLEKIVKTNNKKRFEFNEDHTLIRARQGHSISVDVELKKAVPPDLLYHGTATKYYESIIKEGLISKNRLYVHLSKDLDTAYSVGKRHGEVIIFDVDCKSMIEDGYEFYLSNNNVWLTRHVPVKYLKLRGKR